MLSKYQNYCAAVVMLALLVGCATGPQSSKDAPPVALVADNRVVIDSVYVQIDNGSVDISGQVHRKAGNNVPVSGRVDIEFVGPNGYAIDGLPALIVPSAVAYDKPSVFHTSYGFIPPKGSFLRIHFVDSATEAREDLEGGMFDAGVDGGGPVGGNNGVHPAGWIASQGAQGGHASQNHYNNGHVMQFGNNFGSVNFGYGGSSTGNAAHR